MAEPAAHREQLRADFLAQTARIRFSELQRYFAAGKLVVVSEGQDLVEVAVELALDNTTQFATWIDNEALVMASAEQAMRWHTGEVELWAVVANPWVLVQEHRSASAPGDAETSGVHS